MAEQGSKNAQQGSDEIDLGQLFRLIGKGFQNVFNTFLRVFLYIKGRVIILGILAIVGFATGYGLSKIITKKQKIEVIVKPNLESKNYLYDVVNEIQANIRAKDTLFFKNLGINVPDLGGYEVKIETVSGESEKRGEDIEYLELLQKFENTAIISDVLRAEILNRSSLNHRITILYKDARNGPVFAKKMVEYINSNEFFQNLVATNKENAETRIEENKMLIEQIDRIVTNYSEKMAQQPVSAGDGRIVFENEETVNITGLFDLKNMLIRDIEGRKLSLLEQKEPISIINFGKPHQIQRAFFGKKVVLVPTILILLFFLIDFVRYLNRKAGDLE
jgi:hypothetical protein